MWVFPLIIAALSMTMQTALHIATVSAWPDSFGLATLAVAIMSNKIKMPLQAVHNFFKQYGPLPKLGTTTVTSSGVSDYGGKPMSVIKVTYEGRGQKRKRDDSGGKRGDRAAGRGGVGQQNGGGNGADAGGQWGKEWPGGTKKYCKFALGKTNMDTQVGSSLLPGEQLFANTHSSSIITKQVVVTVVTVVAIVVIVLKLLVLLIKGCRSEPMLGCRHISFNYCHHYKQPVVSARERSTTVLISKGFYMFWCVCLQQCIGLLASLMHCKPGTFATAGTKDKRAVTVQNVTAFKV